MEKRRNVHNVKLNLHSMEGQQTYHIKGRHSSESLKLKIPFEFAKLQIPKNNYFHHSFSQKKV